VEAGEITDGLKAGKVLKVTRKASRGQWQGHISTVWDGEIAGLNGARALTRRPESTPSLG